VVIIGPSAEVISGSLLRPINIYYSLRDLRGLKVKYISVKKLSDLLPQLFPILYADMVIASGVNPWISALVTLWRKISRKMVIVDFHGFAWIEVNATNVAGFPMKMLLLVSERVSYKLSWYVIMASKWLANALAHYFGERRGVFVIENAVPYIFEEVVHKLVEKYDPNTLRKYICEKVLCRGDCFSKPLLIAPLPTVFRSNILAYEELLRLSQSLGENVLIAVTGIKTNTFSVSSNIVLTGYTSYVNYVGLLLSSDSVILPYPMNAICGGVRNKVLEAGFCKKPVISTKAGMMHLNASPNIHYVPISIEAVFQELRKELLKEIAEKLNTLISKRYSFILFKKSLLKLVKSIIRG